jgi:uncharacterized surface protein with fasciclin (FAS1) repeats
LFLNLKKQITIFKLLNIIMKKFLNSFRKPFFFGAAVMALTFSACKKSSSGGSTDSTINGIVSSNADFSTLNAGVVKAGLAATLSSTGPFTVFAPNNAAFTASGITSQVLASLSPAQVKNILLYHTIAAKIMAAQVPAGPNAAVAAANGDSLYVTKNANGVFVNGIQVTKADVAASNGIIHVIGKVLMPPSGNIVQVAQSDTTFSYLVAAVLRASEGGTNVAAILSGKGPFTVFAPTNNAFRAAGFPTIASVQAAPSATLTSILTYHVIGARVFSSDLSNGLQASTLNGGKVTFGLTSGATVKGNSNPTPSNIIATNIVATNGVVHVIDQVLLP